MTCQKLQNKMQQRDHDKRKWKWERVSYLCIVPVTSQPDGSLQASGAIFSPSRIYMSHNDDENGFSLWSEQRHFTEHIRAREPPMVSCCLWKAEQQVNGAHMEKADARVLIIKKALHLSSCIVRSHNVHKQVYYPFQHWLGKIIISCPLIQQASHKSLLSSKLHHCSQAMAASSENSAMHWDGRW